MVEKERTSGKGQDGKKQDQFMVVNLYISFYDFTL